jgi:hypothetical protein
VQEFPGAGGKVQTFLGRRKIGARKGRELFYLSGDRMMAVDVTTAPAFKGAAPHVLFERNITTRGSATRTSPRTASVLSW